MKCVFKLHLMVLLNY